LPTLPFFGLFMVAMILGYILAFAFNIGSWGVWLAIAVSNVIGGVAALLWIKYGNWAKTDR